MADATGRVYAKYAVKWRPEIGKGERVSTAVLKENYTTLGDIPKIVAIRGGANPEKVIITGMWLIGGDGAPEDV